MARGWMVAGLALLVATGCDDDSPTGVPTLNVETVIVSTSRADLLVGDTVTLRAAALTAEGDTVRGLPVTWSVDAGTLVSISGSGSSVRAWGAAAGATRVTAVISGRSGSVDLAVANPAPALNTMLPDSVPAGSGTFTLTVQGSGFVQGSIVHWNGAPRATTFRSAGELEAIITANDLVSTGEAQVQVVTGGPGGGTSAPRTFRVTDAAPQPQPGVVAAVTISADSLLLGEGEVVQLTAVARDPTGAVITGRAVVWTAADPEIAAVDALGAVTGVRNGATVIRARVDGVTAQIPARTSTIYPYQLLYSGWDGSDVASARFYRTDLSDTDRAAVRAGPDVPSGGAVPSPDGTRIAYLMDGAPGFRRLMVADFDGSDATEILTTSDFSCGRFTWSPDGARLAFGCAIGDADRDIWVVNADGTGLANLTDAHSGHQEWPSWSPELPGGGTRIAYAQFVQGEPQIWTMADDGSDPRQVTSGMDRAPAWSPDGLTIAFQRTGAATFGDIYLVDAGGGNVRGLVGAHLAGPQDAPAWSPDGRLVAFSSTHETFGTGQTVVHQIYTVWADGSKLARRTDGTFQVGNPAWRVRGRGGAP